MPRLPPRIKTLLILAKNCWKIEIKTFPYFAMWHEKSFEFVSNIQLTLKLETATRQDDPISFG